MMQKFVDRMSYTDTSNRKKGYKEVIGENKPDT